MSVESERDSSKTCSVSGTKDGNQRVEHGLYVCEVCDTVAKADANSAENIRQKVTPSPSHDKSNGLLAHSDEAKSRLDLFKGDDESYNDVIIRLTSHDKWAGFGIASSMDNEGMDEIREQMRSRMDDHIEELEQ